MLGVVSVMLEDCRGHALLAATVSSRTCRLRRAGDDDFVAELVECAPEAATDTGAAAA
jgi:hypothetical protein